MNALSEDFWGTVDTSKASTGRLKVRDTHWGFIARQDGVGHEVLIERVMKCLSLALVPIGAVLTFLVGDVPLTGVLLADAGLPLAFIVIGLALYLHASRGFRREVQVDSLNREVRIGVTNNQGSFRCRQTLHARDIDSAFLVRTRNPSRPSSLNLRLRDRARPLLLLEGKEAALQPIFERTAEALKAPPTRKAKPKKSSRRRSLMSLPLWKKRAQSMDR